MIQDVLPAFVNGIAVAVGLFILWSFVGGLRLLPVGTRAGAAIMAGAVSMVITLFVTAVIRALAIGA